MRELSPAARRALNARTRIAFAPAGVGVRESFARDVAAIRLADAADSAREAERKREVARALSARARADASRVRRLV